MLLWLTPIAANLRISLYLTMFFPDVQSTPVFAVHGKLTVKGDANKIWLLESSAEAQHVGNLDVRGDANTIRVVLLDGATYDLEGDANRIKRASSEEEAEGLFTKLRNML